MIEVYAERFALREAFTISRGSRTHAEVVRVTVTRDGVTGQGECLPYPRYGESIASVSDLIAALPPNITRTDLQSALPAGAARNAVDCALWDWEAKVAGRPAWALAGVSAPSKVATAYTLSLGSPEAMRDQAARNAHRPLLKTKLGGGTEDIDRIEAVRDGAPDARIIIDANEGWDVAIYESLAPALLRLGVEMVEQPFPAGADAALAEMDRPLPVCADESCHDRATLAGLGGKYDMVNIKLDKAGGLTEALALHAAARNQGFRIMVGCMMTSSLALAPAMLLAGDADIVDLDAPMLLAEDRDPPMAFDATGICPAEPELWG